MAKDDEKSAGSTSEEGQGPGAAAGAEKGAGGAVTAVNEPSAAGAEQPSQGPGSEESLLAREAGEAFTIATGVLATTAAPDKVVSIQYNGKDSCICANLPWRPGDTHDVDADVADSVLAHPLFEKASRPKKKD